VQLLVAVFLSINLCKKCVVHAKHLHRWCFSLNFQMLLLHWHLINLHCVVMYTVVVCDGGMIMFVHAYVMEVPVMNLAFH